MAGRPVDCDAAVLRVIHRHTALGLLDGPINRGWVCLTLWINLWKLWIPVSSCGKRSVHSERAACQDRAMNADLAVPMAEADDRPAQLGPATAPAVSEPPTRFGAPAVVRLMQ